MKIQKTLAGLALAATTSFAAPTLNQITGWSLNPNPVDYGAESVVLTDADGTNDDATAFLFFEIAGLAGANTFGIYGFTNNPDGTVTLGQKLELFAGAASPITSATVAWNSSHTVATNTGSGLSANIGTNFGFYIARNDGFIGYTHNSLNAGGADMALIFNTVNRGEGVLLGSDVVVAFEDVYGGDFDYNDLVVGVSDVAPVPEPGTLGLMGMGILGLGWMARRRKAA